MKLPRSIALFILAALTFGGASLAFAAWTGPTQTAPGGNVAAPVNVGSTAQVKSGGLWAASMGTDSGYCIGGSCITSWAQAGGAASQWATNGSSIYYNGGNVGIGTSNPGAAVGEKLNVQGPGYFTGDLYAPIYRDQQNGGYYLDPNGTSNLNVIRFASVDCIAGTCPPNQAIRLTPNLHLNAGSGYAVIVNWDNGTVGGSQAFRIGNGQGGDSFYVLANGDTYLPVIHDLNNAGYYLDLNNGSNLNYATANDWYVNSWFRVNTTGGIYWQSYGGGWQMTDSSWLRAYNNVGIYTGGEVQATTVRANSQFCIGGSCGWSGSISIAAYPPPTDCGGSQLASYTLTYSSGVLISATPSYFNPGCGH